MITLEADALTVRFPDVHPDAACRISFLRTLRIPDDGAVYPLPAGLGHFSLRHTDDLARALPEPLARRGGVTLGMWQAEAMWIAFSSSSGYPMAIKVATGKINAVTGAAWSAGLRSAPQDHVVIPNQPWLDGYCVKEGLIRQFVAAPLGAGVTAEEQVTGQAEWGGLQLEVFPMKAEIYRRLIEDRRSATRYALAAQPAPAAARPMGLAPGGLMRQKIYPDPYGPEAWDLGASARCFVTILNAEDWTAVTGERAPARPITAQTYKQNGIPWFDLYDGGHAALKGSKTLARLKSSKDFAGFGLLRDLWRQKPPPPPTLVVTLEPPVSAPVPREVRESSL